MLHPSLDCYFSLLTILTWFFIVHVVVVLCMCIKCSISNTHLVKYAHFEPIILSRMFGTLGNTLAQLII